MNKQYRIVRVTQQPGYGSANIGKSFDRFTFFIEKKVLFWWRKVRGYDRQPLQFSEEKSAKDYADALRRVGQVTYIEVW